METQVLGPLLPVGEIWMGFPIFILCPDQVLLLQSFEGVKHWEILILFHSLYLLFEPCEKNNSVHLLNLSKDISQNQFIGSPVETYKLANEKVR